MPIAADATSAAPPRSADAASSIGEGGCCPDGNRCAKVARGDDQYEGCNDEQSERAGGQRSDAGGTRSNHGAQL